MPRLYRVSFEKVSITVAQDLVTIVLPTSAANFKALSIARYWVEDTDGTLPTPQMLALRVRLLPATATLGSGGTTPTPVAMDQGDSAAKCSAHVNDTTKATTNGTAVVLDERACHISNGFDSAQSGQPPIPIVMNTTSQVAVVFELLNAPNGSNAIILSGGMDIIEGG